MAKRCTRKQITRVDFKRCGRGKSKVCPVATIHKSDRRPTTRTKGGGKLVDGGKRMLGGFKNRKAAEAAAAKWMAKHDGLVC